MKRNRSALAPLPLAAWLVFLGMGSSAEASSPTIVYAQPPQNGGHFEFLPDLASLITLVESAAVSICESGWTKCTMLALDIGKDSVIQNWEGCVVATGWCQTSYTAGSYEYLTCPPNQAWWEASPGNYMCLPYIDVTSDRPKSCPWVGQPINPLTGVQRHELPLGLRVGGIDISATYDTRTKLPVSSGGPEWIAPPPPSLGDLWQTNFHKSATLQLADAVGGASTGLALQNGANVNETMVPTAVAGVCGTSFTQPTMSANSNYASSVDPMHQVVAHSDGSVFLTNARDLVEESYGPDGRISVSSYADGRVVSYTYNTVVAAQAPVVGLLTQAADQFGRTLVFAYQQWTSVYGLTASHLVSVTDSAGASVGFGYDPTSGYLDTVNWPDGKHLDLHYERVDLPWAMTSIYDEAGTKNITLDYDAYGRASKSVEGTNANLFTITYDSSPELAPRWKVEEMVKGSVICRVHTWLVPPTQKLVNPMDQSITMQSMTLNGMPFLSGQSQPAGSGCAASTSAQGFDAAGNMTSYDDFDGNRSCYAYDLGRNLRTVTLEGLAGGASGKACPISLASYAPSEADATHPERKITTQWHPDWALKTREAEPLKITTWVYNGQIDPLDPNPNKVPVNCAPMAAPLPDLKPIAVLCLRYEQATTDATGGAGIVATNNVGNARLWSYNYDANGQLQTAITPRQLPGETDLSKYTTTYAYYQTTDFSNGASGHTMGDLQSMRNGLGQTTQYLSYDKAGRLFSSQDPNNIVTTRTYWPRGWLHTQTVTPAAGAPLTTTYDYWPTGLLHVVTLPDTTTLTYTYDDAHRLTDVVDSAGNTVHYTMDNAGNRTGEQVKDASGKLAASVTRVFDALERVQSVTGAAH